MDHQSHEPARFWYYYDFSPLQPGRYYCGDCFQLLPAIESGTVDMVLIDPPYYMGKDKAWDCFEGRADYMAFMGRAFIQAQRILKENGTLGFWHNDLQKITWLCDWLERNTDMRFATWGIWVKPNHRRKIWVNPGPGNTLRSWFNIGEFCVFFVKGTAGTAWNKTGLELAKLNTENFGSLRDYFRRLLEYTDVTKRQIIETVGQSADHCFRFGSTQWLLPTRETYLKIVAAFHCDSWEGYRTFESLEAERNNAMASYADQIQEANAARFVHNLDAIISAELTQIVQATLTAAGWSASAPYTQTVAVAGVTAGSPPYITPVYSGVADADIALREACAAVSYAKPGAGTVTFVCLEDKPQTNIPVQVEVKR